MFPIAETHVQPIPIVTPTAVVVCGLLWLPLVQHHGDSDQRVWRSAESRIQYLEWPFGGFATGQWNIDDAHYLEAEVEAEAEVEVEAEIEAGAETEAEAEVKAEVEAEAEAELEAAVDSYLICT